MPKCFIVHFTKYIDTGSGRMIQYSGGIIAGSKENVREENDGYRKSICNELCKDISVTCQ